jgi:hypothetical protein
VPIGATDYSALHQKSSDGAPTVVLLHGWPDSVLRFERILPLLTDVPYSHLFSLDESELADDDKAYLAAGREWQMSEGSYGLQQSTKPHTLAVGLADSPAGLLAWIVEKLRSWSDCNGDVESVFSRDDLLTWVTAYRVRAAIALAS